MVVAAAGNYGKPDGPSGVPYAPGNDPFVITVGAVDLEGSVMPTTTRRAELVGVRLHARTASASRSSRLPAAT